MNWLNLIIIELIINLINSLNLLIKLITNEYKYLFIQLDMFRAYTPIFRSK